MKFSSLLFLSASFYILGHVVLGLTNKNDYLIETKKTSKNNISAIVYRETNGNAIRVGDIVINTSLEDKCLNSLVEKSVFLEDFYITYLDLDGNLSKPDKLISADFRFNGVSYNFNKLKLIR